MVDKLRIQIVLITILQSLLQSKYFCVHKIKTYHVDIMNDEIKSRKVTQNKNKVDNTLTILEKLQILFNIGAMRCSLGSLTSKITSDCRDLTLWKIAI